MAKKDTLLKQNTAEIIEAAARKSAEDNRKKKEKKVRSRGMSSMEHHGYKLRKRELIDKDKEEVNEEKVEE